MAKNAGLPSTMRKWQYTSNSGGVINNLKLNASAAVPTPKSDEHLVKITAVGLNPADWKVAENAIMYRLLIPNPATPGLDISGIIVKPAAGSNFKPGQRILGTASKNVFAAGGLADYAAVHKDLVVPLPDNVTAIDAAAMPAVASTAWQSVLPHIKSGSRVFINGGSGGVGTAAIQLAKAHGAHVTVSCSTANVDFCKSLGADEVIDYKKAPVIQQLQQIAKNGSPFDLIVDYIGSDWDLFWQCQTYTAPSAKFVSIVIGFDLGYVWNRLRIAALPGFLGGGKRRYIGMIAKLESDQIAQIAAMMSDGKLKAVLDEVYPMEQAIEAFGRSASGRTRGKLIIRVAQDEA